MTVSSTEEVPVEAARLSEIPEAATTLEEWMSQIDAQEQPGEAAVELAHIKSE
ncbi:hypothetical protein [Leptolyngbya sp. CCY15150]|uniref:hypothetical protein n=1 Tax=Leptolyngbya sp. CCY15150 TaxID=2767772 RepID=UPI00194DC4C8|nr:hypothetical protein [Leptolyngbya sp. CCY15150]